MENNKEKYEEFTKEMYVMDQNISQQLILAASFVMAYAASVSGKNVFLFLSIISLLLTTSFSLYSFYKLRSFYAEFRDNSNSEKIQGLRNYITHIQKWSFCIFVIGLTFLGLQSFQDSIVNFMALIYQSLK